MKFFNLLKGFFEKFSFKIFAVFTVFIIIISVSFITFFIQFVHKYQEDKLISEGKILTDLLAYNSRIGVFSENISLLKGPIEGILQQRDVLCASVFNLQGRILYEQDKNIKVHGKNKRQGGQKVNQIFTRLKEAKHPINVDNKDDLEFWAPILSEATYLTKSSMLFQEQAPQKKGAIIGFICIKLNKEELHRKVNSLLYNSILLGIIFLFMGLVVTFFVAHEITRPLKKLTEGVKVISRGGTVETVPVETEDEIGKLAKAFNNMSEALTRRELEKNQLQKQLNHAQKMEAIGTLAGGIAHDFNNILTAIIGHASLLQMEITKNSPFKEGVDNILDAAQRAANLTKSLLAFSRKQNITFSPVNLNKIIKSTKKILLRLINDNIEFKFTLAKEDLIVMADAGQIDHILFNFATNARDAMPDGGVLSITTKSVKLEEKYITDDHIDKDERASRYALIRIEDTGMGMDNKTLERIFDPFFTTKEIGKGTGLGLSMAYGIIKQHMGYIDVSSQEGKGTQFKIYLPIIEGNMETKKVKSSLLPKRGTETLLIAEDDNQVKNLSIDLFGRYGYKVIAAINGEDAVKKFKENMERIQFLLFDVIMPKMNGKEAYEEIKKIKPNIKALFMSGYDDHIINKTGIWDGGGVDFISKPLSPQRLLIKVRDLLDKK